MLCRLNMALLEKHGNDLVSKENAWRALSLNPKDTYKVYAVGKNLMSEDCELLIDLYGDGALSWQRVSVFEVIDDSVPDEWVVRLNFKDSNVEGDVALWSFLMSWPELFSAGCLVGLLNLDGEQLAQVHKMLRHRKAI